MKNMKVPNFDNDGFCTEDFDPTPDNVVYKKAKFKVTV